jgi:hypothetical protein
MVLITPEKSVFGYALTNSATQEVKPTASHQDDQSLVGIQTKQDSCYKSRKGN